MNTSGMKMIDIGANLTDDVFKGAYHGKQAHEGDLDAVLRRASAAGVHKIVVTAGQLPEVKEALELVHAADPGGERLFLTVGVHPTRCGEFEKSGDAQAYLDELMALAKEGAASGRVVAIGECGLDYDRLHFCDALTQKKYFELQFQLAEATGLPMFLHMRAAAADFVEILERNRSKFSAGVVHSFTGSKEELDRLLRLDGIYIGINGCSLKTEENLDVMAAIPLDRMMLETDAPWCEVKATHAGFKYVKTKWETRKKEKHSLECCVKNRCEPCHMQQVLEVVAGHRGIEDLDELSTTLYDTTCKVFFPQEA
eukprot:CAMPEP_0114224704 /NCGR_PEP_ID=MMETSP0058-20121206/254_1 /TAXON_ID=36894 /ORGANISM="Pyramimonas parkeae, CCMP726" /LENGTH=311 /DNA_ID=CAMNT_0001335207 /DNA_START=524 /DNA_END=1459 /DNA_ORIENTATION=-